MQRGSLAGNAQRCNKLDFGDYGLQTLERGWITNNQIESMRVAVNRHLNRRAQLWLRLFPDKPVSKKPLETRMGKGKGNPEFWVAPVHPGRILLEISGCSEVVAREALSRAANKLPLRCKMLSRDNL